MSMVGFVTFVVIGALGVLAVSEVVGQEADVPAVSEVSMFSAPASGDTHEFGDPIEVRVDFERLVTITGTPQVNLTVGSTTRAVGLTGPAVHCRSRTSSLFFEYTVVAADRDADGISVAADAISLNGGSIKAAADGTTDAGLTHLTHAALTPGSGHKVDGSKNEVPVVSSVSFVGLTGGRRNLRACRDH